MDNLPLQLWTRLRVVLSEIDSNFSSLQSHIPTDQVLRRIQDSLSELMREDEDSFVTAPSHASARLSELDNTHDEPLMADNNDLKRESASPVPSSPLFQPRAVAQEINLMTPNREDSDSEIFTVRTNKSKRFVISSSSSDADSNQEESPIRKASFVAANGVIHLSSDDEPRTPTAKSANALKAEHSKGVKEEKQRKRQFKNTREALARSLFADLNKAVFAGKLEDDMQLEWNNRLQTTAGQTRSTRNGGRISSKIVLSSKVLDSKEKLETTLAHEMCHAAVACINGIVGGPPHGADFKQWADRVMRVYPRLDVRTCHNFEIEYKYRWECVGCKRVIGRHSKSIDVSTQKCAHCHSDLKPLFAERPPTAFQAYLKENMKDLKQAMPSSPHHDIMQQLSRQFREQSGTPRKLDFLEHLKQ